MAQTHIGKSAVPKVGLPPKSRQVPNDQKADVARRPCGVVTFS